MIMPRRYGGPCLPLAEAMTSGLPVTIYGLSMVVPEHSGAPGRYPHEA